MGDTLDDEKVIKKCLHVVPPKYSQVAIAIKTLLNQKTLSIEELTGWLKSVEEQYDNDDTSGSGGHLLLTQEEWLAHIKRREQSEASFGSERKSSGNGSNDRHCGKQGNWWHSSGSHDVKDGNCSGGGRNKSKFKYFNCGILGHYAKECRKPRRERKEANLAWVRDEQPASLLKFESCDFIQVAANAPQLLFLNEEKMIPADADDDVWYLDMGTSNHMIGCKSLLTSLDETVKGSVKFGDGSVVEICSKSVVML